MAPEATQAGLSEEEWAVLVRGLGRQPSPAEALMAGVLWSEHCSYKHSKTTLRSFPTSGSRVAVGPGENAGVLDIGGGMLLAAKIESHNHPSAVEPLQGAATGLGGIMRDVLSAGARPIAFLDALFFAPPGDATDDWLARGIVAGVARYGNCVGVATVGGLTRFDEAYARTPLVNALCIGIAPRDGLLRSTAGPVGSKLVLIGAATGRDGVGGAALASRDTSQDEATRPQVQIGDPFQGKLLVEAVLELAEKGLVCGLGDLGAAGITSAAAEMAARAGRGVRLDLSAVPLRETGMTAAEILLSETQERMLACVRPEDVEAALAICARWGLPAAVIGTVTEEPTFHAALDGDVACTMPITLLSGGAPLVALREGGDRMSPVAPPADILAAARHWVGSAAFPSRRQVFEHFDDRVGLRTAVGPGGEAALLRVWEAGVTVAATVTGRPRLVAADAFSGAAETVLEALRRLAAVGARPIGITDCLNFGDPDDAGVASDFVAAVRGIAQVATALSIPVIGGNVSFYNGQAGEPILPTPVVGMVGLVDPAIDVAALRRAKAGEFLFLLGEAEGGTAKGPLPGPDVDAEARLAEEVIGLLARGAVGYVKTIGHGGLMATVLGLAADSGTGLRLVTPQGADRPGVWYGEGGPRYLIAAPQGAEDWLRDAAGRAGGEMWPLGTFGGDAVLIDGERVSTVEHLVGRRGARLWETGVRA